MGGDVFYDLNHADFNDLNHLPGGSHYLNHMGILLPTLMRPDTAGVHRRARVMAQSHVAPHCGATDSAPQTQSVSRIGGHGHRYTLTDRRHSHNSLESTTVANAMDSPPSPLPPILGSNHDATTGALVGSEIPGGSAPSAGTATEGGPCLPRPPKPGRRPAECAGYYAIDKSARQLTCRACMVRI